MQYIFIHTHTHTCACAHAHTHTHAHTVLFTLYQIYKVMWTRFAIRMKENKIKLSAAWFNLYMNKRNAR